MQRGGGAHLGGFHKLGPERESRGYFGFDRLSELHAILKHCMFIELLNAFLFTGYFAKGTTDMLLDIYAKDTRDSRHTGGMKIRGGAEVGLQL